MWLRCNRQGHYDRVASQHVTRLLLPHLETRFDSELSTKEKLRRVVRAGDWREEQKYPGTKVMCGHVQIHARHVHDPTNALQNRLREAEREVYRLELRQVSWLAEMRYAVDGVVLLTMI